MATEPICVVRGCTSPPETVFTHMVGAMPMEYIVCNFHRAALDAGEKYAEYDHLGRPELVLGGDTLPYAFNAIVTIDAVSDPVVELILGHDEIEEQRVKFHLTPEIARALWENIRRRTEE